MSFNFVPTTNNKVKKKRDVFKQKYKETEQNGVKNIAAAHLQAVV